ncbi:hypothetical protein POJ06DRAFT_260251 [Lipomyces tetrasporus]|uniref:1-acyl-sn-glycerol-3-phosphate acyltransferase n=1 Tax=Lipomyces tetrasporus TaxID=54092 RepID=A0AAD7VQQ5_9ASCO|nr:uncharacterized protein POJ06DRAFT_260251 [Lipomyces tetrasporus]KAJ8097839.1 hypothetical protein POJ06DRAFT_260251 [Lipomyces tetrasporus]
MAASDVLLSGLGIVIAFTMSLNILGLIYRPLQFYGKFMLCFLSMCTCASYGFFASIVLSLIGKKGLSQWTAGRAFSTLTCPIIGLKINIKNEEILKNTRPAVIIANHQTELDVLLLGRIFPKYCSVTAKSSLKYVPFLGWFMMISGTVFIDRQNRGKAIKALDGAINTMKTNNQCVFIFPEGTRSYFTEPDMLSFKRGAFHLALQSGFPIIPVVISNYSNVFSFRKRILQAGNIDIQVLDPVSTEGFASEDLDELLEATRSKMLDVLKQISPQAAKQPTGEVDSEDTTLLSASDTANGSVAVNAIDDEEVLEPRISRDTDASELSAVLSASATEGTDLTPDVSKVFELDTRN